MDIDNIKNLMIGILTVLLLLSICMTVDYADETITVDNPTAEQTIKEFNKSDIIIVNDTYASDNDVGVAKIQKVVIEKPKLPLVTITAKPSVRSNYAYKWHTRTWVNYCPNCKHYNVLLINPKGVPERELTCKRCSSDFCGVTGKEKYSWSHVYLRRV